MSVACAVLMCHAPIVIPQIAGKRARDCAATTRAMQEVAAALVAHEVDVCVVVSPHAPRDRTRWGIGFAETLEGSFARFGHPELAQSFNGAPHAAALLAHCAERRGLETHLASCDDLDHGAMVPLHFLREAGYHGRIVLVALPYPHAGSELVFGAAIREAAEGSDQRWAVLASGDMSHRLTHDAPAGYTPRGREFDQQFVALLRRGDLRDAITLPEDLVTAVAEDVVQSTAVAAGAIAFDAHGARVIEYEGPFGVGYCEALLFSHGTEQPREKAREPDITPADARQRLVELAVAAIEAQLTGELMAAPELDPPWNAPRAVFVTLRSPDGALRGCIGRTEPLAGTLAAEIIDCATAAATRDHRVLPVDSSELAALQVEVSLLSPIVPIANHEELDPARFGVVVKLGTRRGVLLPGIEGIATVADQLAVALHKARIDPSAPYEIACFTVDKIARTQSMH